MKTSNAAERLLASIDWSILRALGGDGESVQHALRELLASENAEAAERAYWGVENHAFVQGELFEVSEACSSVLVASLVDPREKWVRVAALELMFQILSGHASTSPGTPNDIVQRCHRTVREGLWLLYREAICGERDAAFDVLEQLGEAEKVRRLLNIPSADST
jgi:hypothetical protein